jgi:hypothetical protein
MNMFSFKKGFTKHLQTSFDRFLEKNKADLSKAESLLPSTLSEFIESGEVEVSLIPTTATWYGMTYKEDLQKVSDSIQALVDKGEYPQNLWANLKTKD